MVQSFDNPSDVLYKGHIVEVRQTVQFESWLGSLRDRLARARILDRLLRVADGNFGDPKSVGGGVEELRWHFGPGYRVYFKRYGTTVVLLLVGGDKDDQRRDIAHAQELAMQEDHGI